MRTVHLSPDHSSWWLLSPGITLYFDELRISRKDHQKVIASAGDSSYHEQVALHYERFMQSGVTNICVIDDAEMQSDAMALGKDLAEGILTSAECNPEFIAPTSLILLARNSFLNWIQYNQRRLRYLRTDEPLYTYLNDQLHEWELRLDRFDKLLDQPSEDTFSEFREDKELLSTFTRLVTSAERCIELTDRGLRIYDPMLEHYMPMIELLERFISVQHSSSTNIFETFDAYSFRMYRYGEIVPVQLGMDGLFKTIEDFATVRRQLEAADKVFSSIETDDLGKAFHLAKQEISPLINQARAVSAATEYAFWGIGLKYDFLSWLALPFVTDKLKGAAGAMSLIANHTGKFAGSYALIAEQLISHQQLIKSSHRPRTFDAHRYERHFNNFINRDSHDKNAI